MRPSFWVPVSSSPSQHLLTVAAAIVAFMLVGMGAASEAGGEALLYYRLVYASMNLGALAVVMGLAQHGEKNEELDDCAGLGFKYPAMGMSMVISMRSLGGCPDRAGCQW